jgi:hypothetical protein
MSNTKEIDTVGVNKICSVADTRIETGSGGGNKGGDGEKSKRMSGLCWRPEEIITK